MPGTRRAFCFCGQEFRRQNFAAKNPEDVGSFAAGKVAGRERCHEEATRTAPVPAGPHGSRRCGGPEHSAGLSKKGTPTRQPSGPSYGAFRKASSHSISDYRAKAIATPAEINQQIGDSTLIGRRGAFRRVDRHSLDANGFAAGDGSAIPVRPER